MSQYNKTVLTNAGLELAKRANAGQTKFGITRAVTSADDWSYKTTQDLEDITTIPNVMQQGTIMDAEEVESNNAVIGVSLRFTNKDLNTGYQIRIIGLYVKEEGQDNEILYAVTTAVTPEYMPGFGDKVLYRFNMQMYLVIGKAQAVNVVIDDGTAVTHGQFDKYKADIATEIKTVQDSHKEDMTHVAKSASLNGGDKVLPDSNGNIDLSVPNPDLSKYVNIDDLNKLLLTKADVTAIPNKLDTENGIKEALNAAKIADSKAQNALNTKANTVDVYNKSDVDTMMSKSYFRKQGMDQNGNPVEVRATATKQSEGGYAFDITSSDQTATKLKENIDQVASIRNVLNGIQKDKPNFNDITQTGNYYITNAAAGQNYPNGSWGNLIVWYGHGDRLEQLYYPDDSSAPFYRSCVSGVWKAWKQLANQDDLNRLQQQVNDKVNNLAISASTAIEHPFPTNITDLNNLPEGRYNTRNLSDNTWNSIANKPNIDKFGMIICYREEGDGWQLAFSTNNANTLFFRGSSGSTYQPWQELKNYDTTITNLQNSKLALSGGDMNLRSAITWNGGDINAKTGNLGGLTWTGGTDNVKIYGDQNNTDNLDLAIDLGDDASNKVSFRFNGTEKASIVANGYINAPNITDHENRIHQLEADKFEVQTFTDQNAAKNWEAQRPGKRLAIINS